ncbi:MAG: hypothetical protein ACHQ4J_10280 [Candidatus Binatia bacterium]
MSVGAGTGLPLWMLDSSTFINALAIDRVALLVLLRSPLFVPEYVLRIELGVNARLQTQEGISEWVRRKKIGVRQLSIGDLERIAQLAAPRRVGVGELACAIIAERDGGGVLCDDWRARRWLEQETTPACWNSIEDVLVDAAGALHVSEYDLVDFQVKLERARYRCRVDLRLAHLQRHSYRQHGGEGQ